MAAGYRFKVLVVDDDPLVRLIAQEMLEQAGFVVCVAEDGLRGVEALAREHFDVVLLDMLMPEKEGLETLMEIRMRWPAVRVIAISGGGRIGAFDLLHWARTAGADATLVKPLEARALVETVRDVLGEPPSLSVAV